MNNVAFCERNTKPWIVLAGLISAVVLGLSLWLGTQPDAQSQSKQRKRTAHASRSGREYRGSAHWLTVGKAGLVRIQGGMRW